MSDATTEQGIVAWCLMTASVMAQAFLTENVIAISIAEIRGKKDSAC